MQLPFCFDERPTLDLVRKHLLTIYGPQRDELRHAPTPQFFKAVISSRTYDRKSAHAFDDLCMRFPSWDLLVEADPHDVANTINDVTHATRKAEQVVRAAQRIREIFNYVDLSDLGKWSVTNAYGLVTGLPGAGPKVAAATLNFSTLHMRLLTVDTHVLRVSSRLGLIPMNSNYTNGFEKLMQLVPPEWDADDLYELHWLIKMFGQRICTHHDPACEHCPLVSFCAHGRKRLTH